MAGLKGWGKKDMDVKDIVNNILEERQDNIYSNKDIDDNSEYYGEDCDRCGEPMRKMTACHLICENCGSHLDCSDKGSVW